MHLHVYLASVLFLKMNVPRMFRSGELDLVLTFEWLCMLAVLEKMSIRKYVFCNV